MSYVVYDKGSGMYLSKVTEKALGYTQELDEAKVYKTKAGALHAVGVPDKSFKELGKFPPSKKLRLPSGIEIVDVDIAEAQKEEDPYKGIE